MFVELGNAQPHDILPDRVLDGPAVTTIDVNEADDAMTLEPGADVKDLALHLASHPGLVTHLPDHGLFVHVVKVWDSGTHGIGIPTWVACSSVAQPDKAADLERLLSEFWGCPAGKPEDVENTHFTISGAPGVGPSEG